MKGTVLTKAAGVYRILNVVTGFSYIGSTKNLVNRKHKHYAALRRNGHINGNLQEAWNESGELSFEFEVLELVTDLGTLLHREQHHLNIVFACGTQYNLSPTAGNNLGFRHAAESKQQMSAAKSGVARGPLSSQTRHRISQALSGRKASQEAVEKNRAARMGKLASDETKQKMSRTRKGQPKSEEWKARIGAANRLRAAEKRAAKGLP